MEDWCLKPKLLTHGLQTQWPYRDWLPQVAQRKRDEFEAKRQREEEEAGARSLWLLRWEARTWDSCLQSLHCREGSLLPEIPVSPQASSPKLPKL